MLDFVKESDCNIAALMMQTDPEDGMYYAVIFNTKTRKVRQPLTYKISGGYPNGQQ